MMDAKIVRCCSVSIFFVCIFLMALSPVAAEELAESEEAASFDRLGVEDYTGTARAELAGFQTIHGLVASAQACVFLDCDSPRLGVALPTLGAGMGLVGSLVATSDRGITPGHASTINSGTLWGGWLSFAGGYMVADLDGEDVAGLMLLSQLAGIGIGHSLAMNLRPTAGDVRMVNSAGAWSGLYYVMITQGVLDLGQDRRTVGLGLIGATTVGAVGGGVLASNYPMSRGRVGIITSSGILGGLAGAAGLVMIFGDDISARQGTAGISVGSAAGLAVGTLLTQEWDDRDDYPRATVSLSILPTEEADGFQAGISGQF